MKKRVIGVAAMIFFMISFIMAVADDAADLQKLQPLSPEERTMYEKVKDSAPELHKFIITRMYVRTVRQVIQVDASSIFQEHDIDKFLPCPRA